MRIESSAITMSVKHSIAERHTKQESLRWAGEMPASNQMPGESRPQSFDGIIVEISDEAKSLLMNEGYVTETNGDNQLVEIDISEKDKQKILIMQGMIEALTGKKIKFYLPKKIKINPSVLRLPQLNPEAAPPRKQGWGLEYNYHESHMEKESLSFSSQGIIKTVDGKEINFSVQLNMSREFMSQQNIRIRAGDTVAVDPLVINFNGSAPALTDTKFHFDLDSDGKADQISFVGPNSGFLALDISGDGVINNGSELFGPNSGDGFTELARYDIDGNNWIDENDTIYDRLRIWTKDAEGRDQLFALGEKGIGAIFLGNIDTPFAFKNQENQLQGQMRTSSIYVGENGSIGTVQQIDLTI